MGTKNSSRTLKASQTGWIALDQRVLHVKPSPAEHWSLIGGQGRELFEPWTTGVRGQSKFGVPH